MSLEGIQIPMRVEGRIQSYRDLIVWQKAHEFAKKVLGICRDFPETDDAKIIRRQLIRAATSIPANIAEGYGGHKGSAYRNYLIIARRSATEADYWLFLTSDVKFIKNNMYCGLQNDLKEINAILSAIIDKL